MLLEAADGLFNLSGHFPLRLDPRTKTWPLMGNTGFIETLCLTYLMFVLFVGPRWMKNKKPFQMRTSILVYNLFQVIANVLMCTSQAYHVYMSGQYGVFCTGLTYSDDPHSMAIVRNNYLYFFVRVADFLDTIFFIMMKKDSQITFLHVLHHASIVFNGWFFLTFGSDAQVMVGVIVNAFIHVLMYGYYFLAALGPQMKPYLWWKKQLTQIQIIQFIFLCPYVCLPDILGCGYPKALMYLTLPQGIIGLVLFINYYTQTYILKKNKQAVTNGVNGHTNGHTNGQLPKKTE